jgi:hypothetical protein
MRYSSLNKGILLLTVVVCGCHSTVKQQEGKPVHDSIFNTVFRRDSVKIYSETDTLILKKNELKIIEENYPELVKGYPVDPDQDYNLLKSNPKSKADTVFRNFVSEVGQDDYYLLYAYFLRIRNGDEYKGRRDTLNQIYNTINTINQFLKGGGTYFAHQQPRINGYAEYGVYTYANYKSQYIKEGSIVPQRTAFINALKQMITTTVKNDPDGFPQNDKHITAAQLLAVADNLGKLLTDYFYLKKAEEFQTGYYK